MSLCVKNEWRLVDTHMPGEREVYPGIRAVTGMRDKGGDQCWGESQYNTHSLSPHALFHNHHLVLVLPLLVHLLVNHHQCSPTHHPCCGAPYNQLMAAHIHIPDAGQQWCTGPYNPYLPHILHTIPCLPSAPDTPYHPICATVYSPTIPGTPSSYKDKKDAVWKKAGETGLAPITI